MIVIPAINETSFLEIQKKIKQVASWGADPAATPRQRRGSATAGPGDGGVNWVHLDVSDGKFTENKLWNNPADLKNLYPKPSTLNPKLEVHLMVQNPDEVLDEWLDAKVKRVIIHLESAKDIDVMKMKCMAFGAELFLAVKPETPVERLFSYEGVSNGFLILAVNPGLAGQKFKESQLEKIRALRQKFPDAKIEVDGGVNLENALAIKNAGADILVSASAIWGSENPKEAYRKLIEL